MKEKAIQIDAAGLHFQTLCDQVRQAGSAPVTIGNCLGQRYIGSGMQGASITIYGTPGNALGAYFDGRAITVHGNAQDATGDTMNDGRIVIHGSSGDATGYAMRGGAIYVRDGAGYRAGIHMKAYEDRVPALVIGGKAGSFLGEYQAGGKIIVLGLDCDGEPPVGAFCGTGMHGGAIYLRCEKPPRDLPGQVTATRAGTEDMAEIREEIGEFCTLFDCKESEVLAGAFYVLRPNRANPYRQLYTVN